MLRTTTAVAALIALAACSTATPTSWGKAGVSMVDYRLDSAQCIIEASGASVGTDPTMRGEGVTSPTYGGEGASAAGSTTTTGGDGTAASGSRGMTPGGGAIGYQGAASAEDVNQAAMLQRRQELAQRRNQSAAVNDCLRARGYQEFRLTEEQAAHLRSLPDGSAERREYLHSLGSDPAVLSAQSM